MSQNCKNKLHHLQLPSELLDELFASLPFEYAFDLLATMPNGLLARNVCRMLKQFKIKMIENKWNLTDCGSELKISEGNLDAIYSDVIGGFNCVRAVLPVSKFKFNAKKVDNIAFYFEVHILFKALPRWYGDIGFCDEYFSLQGKCLGTENNSIGIWCRMAMKIDGEMIKFENVDGKLEFDVGDVVGCGLLYSPKNSSLKCFSTCNGKLLGWVKLPKKFLGLKLFAAATLCHSRETIRANFGKDEWRYNPLLAVKEINKF